MKTTSMSSPSQPPAVSVGMNNPSELMSLHRAVENLQKQAVTLQTRNADLAAYAHTVAHNLKDPLTVIIAASDGILRITDLTPEELRAYLQQIGSTARKMDDMIDNLLLLSDLEDARVPIDSLDMGGIVTNIVARLGYLITQHRARVNYPERWPVARGYAPWVEEVWANFISNAIKHGARPPHVELGAAVRPDGMILFWTRDDGPGLSREAQDYMSRPLSQFRNVRTPAHGLGLSIARRIVEKLGGQVGVETEAGKGSLFFFTLPAQL